MIRFAREYGTSILQQAVAKLPERALLEGIPWGHHCMLIFLYSCIRIGFLRMLSRTGYSTLSMLTL